uniref:Transmembrane protein n=1 Tax=Cucumis melo TaxID=3656 RepID=A0A9I9DS89_CUCME
MSRKYLVILLLCVILLSTQVVARPYYLSENHHKLTPSTTVPSAVGTSFFRLIIPRIIKKPFPKKSPKFPKIKVPPPPPLRRVRIWSPPSSN